jgi:hypothetical protein
MKTQTHTHALTLPPPYTQGGCTSSHTTAPHLFELSLVVTHAALCTRRRVKALPGVWAEALGQQEGQQQEPPCLQTRPAAAALLRKTPRSLGERLQEAVGW